MSHRGNIVLDGFMGSGTTLLAAERTSRIAYGIELGPLYVDLAVRRWQSLTKCRATLEADGRFYDEIASERASSSTA